MNFPEDGEYVFPFGLAPLRVRKGAGTYWDPTCGCITVFPERRDA
jgi:hypothetical protein